MAITDDVKEALDKEAPLVDAYIRANAEHLKAEALFRMTQDTSEWLSMPLHEQEKHARVFVEHFCTATGNPHGLPVVYVKNILEAQRYLEGFCAQRHRKTRKEDDLFNKSKFEESVILFPHLMAVTIMYRTFKMTPVHYDNVMPIEKRDAFEALVTSMPCGIVPTKHVYVVIAPLKSFTFSDGKLPSFREIKEQDIKGATNEQ